MTTTRGPKQRKATALDTSGLANAFYPTLRDVLARYQATPALRRHPFLRDAGLLAAHMAHLIAAFARLSQLANRPRAVREFQEAMGDAAAHSRKVAALARSVSPPLNRAANRFKAGEVLTLAEIEATFVSIEASLPKDAVRAKQRTKKRLASSADSTRRVRRSKASSSVR